VEVGLTGFVTVVVKPELLYHVAVPVAQVAESVELCPEQIVVGLAEIAVGVVGVGLTVTATFPEILLHPAPLTQDT
jgi:hypothetical protein